MPLPDLPATETAIVELTNQFRAENRLGAVKPNAALTMAAKAYADYLARSGKFAHQADGREPAQRTEAAGYRHCVVAENLALNQDSRGFETRGLAMQAVEGWKGSPPHRKAMLHPHVVEIGVGIAKATDAAPKYISVQLFGRPESLKYTFTIENAASAVVSYGFGEKQHSVPVNGWIKHTACTPGEIVFTGAAPAAPYAASDGAVFRLRRDGGGALRVEMNAAAAGAGPPVATSKAGSKAAPTTAR